jgi:hypothetical protein
MTLTALVTSPSGGTVNDGTVTFTVAGLTATGPVSNGAATATLTLPADLAAGRYPLTARYDDSANANGLNNFFGSGQASALTVGPTATTTALGPVSTNGAFNATATSQMNLSATVSAGGVPIGEGTVTFAVVGLRPVTAAVNSSGTALATVTLPAGFPAGDYAVSASYADSSNANNSLNWSASSSTGTLHLEPAATSVSIGNASASFTSSTQQVALHASLTSPNGGLVNEGTVTFRVAGLSAAAPVLHGSADISLNLPGGLAAGNYALTAAYADTTNPNQLVNFTASSGSSNLAVSPAATQLAVNSATIISTSAAQGLTLYATVSSPNGPVDEGTVTFTVAGQKVTAAVSGGMAVAALTLPAGLAAGQYGIAASYAASPNANSLVNLMASTASGTLAVQQASAVTITQVSLTPGLGGVTEVVTAQVTSPTGPITSGMVTFSVGGSQVQAAVHNGTATAAVLVPLVAAMGPQAVSASYGNDSGLVIGSAASRTAFLNLFNAFLGGALQLQSDGSEVLTLDVFGVPLTFIYNASGFLTGVFVGSVPLLI